MINYLHDWVFHYNAYTGEWDTARRDNYATLFSGKNDKVISHQNLLKLIEVITKTNGVIENAKRLLTLTVTSQIY